MRRALGLLVFAVGVCAWPAQASAQDTVTDERVWFTLNLQERGSADSPWRWTFETILRSREGVSELDVFSLRPTVIYAFNPHVSVAGGYAFAPTFPTSGGTTVEHRPSAQFSFTSGLGGGSVTLRTRMDFRFIEGNSGMLMRFRQQARYARPITKRVSWTVYDELFVHVNNTTRSPRSIDQNRVFGGVQVAAWSSGRIEAGYLNQFSPGHRGAADRMNHVLSTALTISF